MSVLLLSWKWHAIHSLKILAGKLVGFFFFSSIFFFFLLTMPIGKSPSNSRWGDECSWSSALGLKFPLCLPSGPRGTCMSIGGVTFYRRSNISPASEESQSALKPGNKVMFRNYFHHCGNAAPPLGHRRAAYLLSRLCSKAGYGGNWITSRNVEGARQHFPDHYVARISVLVSCYSHISKDHWQRKY